MTAGIAGLGLIGGSFARAWKRKGHCVLGMDPGPALAAALKAGAADGVLSAENMASCNLIILAACAGDCMAFLQEYAPFIAPRTVVLDCAGVKRKICREGFSLAAKYGFVFAGGHPMAGTELSGFDNSSPDMFAGRSMILIPERPDSDISPVKKLLEPAGFGSFTVTDADTHDRIIAYTSQIVHVLSCSYVKNPGAALHRGFSGESFRDMSRVSCLNPVMWAELLMENRDNMLRELAFMTGELEKFRAALEGGDQEALENLLREGTQASEHIK